MQDLRNMIMRRRPAAGSVPAPDDAAPTEEPSILQPPRDLYLDAAREARDFVPRPERPELLEQPEDRRAPSRVAPLRQTSGQDRVPSVMASILAEFQARPPSRPETSAAALKVWDVQPEAVPEPEPAPEPARALPRRAERRPEPARNATPDRAKTRLLGFHSADMGGDPFEAEAVETAGATPFFPIGWLVVVEGPGRGASFTLTAGLSTLGRETGQTVTLDFGDSSISRERHASIAYDTEDRRTYIGHGGKSNIVRLNGKPLLTTEELADGDLIKLGKTTLRFVGFCDESFAWADEAGAEAGDGSQDG